MPKSTVDSALNDCSVGFSLGDPVFLLGLIWLGTCGTLWKSRGLLSLLVGSHTGIIGFYGVRYLLERWIIGGHGVSHQYSELRTIGATLGYSVPIGVFWTAPITSIMSRLAAAET